MTKIHFYTLNGLTIGVSVALVLLALRLTTFGQLAISSAAKGGAALFCAVSAGYAECIPINHNFEENLPSTSAQAHSTEFK